MTSDDSFKEWFANNQVTSLSQVWQAAERSMLERAIAAITAQLEDPTSEEFIYHEDGIYNEGLDAAIAELKELLNEQH